MEIEAESAPTFDLANTNFGLVKRRWEEKAHLEFGRFRERVVTRLDRADPVWSTRLAYPLPCPQPRHYSVFEREGRKENLVPSRYPMRQAMELTPREGLRAERGALGLGGT